MFLMKEIQHNDIMKKNGNVLTTVIPKHKTEIRQGRGGSQSTCPHIVSIPYLPRIASPSPLNRILTGFLMMFSFTILMRA